MQWKGRYQEEEEAEEGEEKEVEEGEEKMGVDATGRMEGGGGEGEGGCNR